MFMYNSAHKKKTLLVVCTECILNVFLLFRPPQGLISEMNS